MYSFFIALAILIGGYFIYGTFVERVLDIDETRKTPAYRLSDGVDYIPLPTWKVFLIQFLNIAGLGPIFGAIMGIMYGPAAFLWIAIGTIFGGAVHDYLSGMMSLNRDGASLPEVVGDELGVGIKQVMRGFALILMILVGAVFVINPAQLLAGMTPETLDTQFWVIAIFIYYILATLLPIDKLIGNLYPIFGFALLFMAVGVLVALIGNLEYIPEFSDGLYNRYVDADSHPIFPMMFVSIACGAISGFHATQSPLMARCIKNERLGRRVFYGAMVVEGIVALIWSAAAIAFFKGNFSELSNYLGENSAAPLVNTISIMWLGKVGGILAILGVIAAPITSGDTALRTARLISADFLRLKQNTIVRRLIISVPIFFASYLIMQINYQVLWRYFGWCNQALSVFTLWAITVYLAKNKKQYIITLLPAIFMTMVCVTYIIYAPEGFTFDNYITEWISQHVQAFNAQQVNYFFSILIASIISIMLTTLFYKKVVHRTNG